MILKKWNAGEVIKAADINNNFLLIAQQPFIILPLPTDGTNTFDTKAKLDALAMGIYESPNQLDTSIIFGNGVSGISDKLVLLKYGNNEDTFNSDISYYNLFFQDNAGDYREYFLMYKKDDTSIKWISIDQPNNDLLNKLGNGTNNQIKYIKAPTFDNDQDIINKKYADDSVVNIEAGIAKNKANIDANKVAISTNTNEIAANKTGITSNTATIATNKTDIGANKTSIASNKTLIDTNTSNIATNKTNIDINKVNTIANKTIISSNTTTINKNKVDISQHTDDILVLEGEVEAINNDLNFITFYNSKTGSLFLIGDSGRELTTTVTLNNIIKEVDNTPLNIFIGSRVPVAHPGYQLKSKINGFVDGQEFITFDGKSDRIKVTTAWTPQGSPTANKWEVKVTLTSTIVGFFHFMIDNILTKIITSEPKNLMRYDFTGQDASTLGTEGQTVKVISGKLKGIDVGTVKAWEQVMTETDTQTDPLTQGFIGRFNNKRPIQNYLYKVSLWMGGVNVAGYDAYFFQDPNNPNKFLSDRLFRINGKICVISMAWTILTADVSEFKLYASTTDTQDEVPLTGGKFMLWMYLEA